MIDLNTIGTICHKHKFAGKNCPQCNDELIREQTVNECVEVLLKQMHPMVHKNGYPSMAVAHATILELPALMKIQK